MQRLDRLRSMAPELRARLVDSGRVTSARVIELRTVQVRVADVLGPARLPLPFALLTLRTLVVESDGKKLVFDPSDARVDADLVAFADLRGRDVSRVPRLVAPHAQIEAARRAHPLDRMRPVRGIADAPVLEYEEVHFVAPGVALVHTPGPAPGHQTLFVHGADGAVWCASATAVSADAHCPYASRIPGFRQAATAGRLDVIVPGQSSCPVEHYDSLILEKAMCDAVVGAPAFPRFVPVRALTASARAPGLAPTAPTTLS